MITIAHISVVHPALDGRIFYREALSLKRMGFNITVWGLAKEDMTIQGVTIRHLPYISSRWKRFCTSWYSGLKAIRLTKADFYQLHDPELLPVGVIAKCIMRKRVIFDAHEDASLVLLKHYLPKWSRPWVMRLMNVVDYLSVSRFDGVIAATRRVADRYRPISKRCEVFRNLPSEDFLQERTRLWKPWSARKNQVLHVGAVSHSRLPLMIDIASRFLREHTGWTWRFVGLGPEVHRQYQSIVKDDFDGRLTAEGRIAHMDVVTELCNAKIGFNFHILQTAQVQMAIPVKVLEYLACGMTTLTTRVPLLVEVLQNCPGVTYYEDNVDDAVRGLKHAVDNISQRDLSLEISKYVDDNLTCRIESERLSHFYKNILQSENTMNSQ